MNPKHAFLLHAIVMGAMSAAPALAQQYPVKPIRFVTKSNVTRSDDRLFSEGAVFSIDDNVFYGLRMG